MALFNRFVGTPEDLAGFAFKQRHGKINWRQVEEMDLDRVLQTGDPEAVQSALENLTFALLDREDLEKLSDSKAVQLFKLMQLALEYLLNVQNSLYAQTQQTQTQYADTHAQRQALETKVRTQEEDAATLKRELESKRKALVSYEYMLRQPSSAAAATQAVNRANAVRCPNCSKCFMSKEFLDKHELRRHADHKPDAVVEKKEEIAFGQMLETMKTIISQNIAVVTDTHKREMEAVKSAFERKIQEMESTRQSLELRRTELEATPSSAVNEMVLRELINTQNEMRKVLEDRDKLILEQMRLAEEQRKRQEEAEKTRQGELERRIAQLVEDQLQAHLPPPEPVPSPVKREPPAPIVPQPVLQPVQPTVLPPVQPAIPPPSLQPAAPTSLDISIQRQPIRSRAGEIEADEPSDGELLSALSPEKGKDFVLEEEGQVSSRQREMIASDLREGLLGRESEEEELNTAAGKLGLRLDKEPELEFVVRAYLQRSKKEMGSSGAFGGRLLDVFKKTIARLRTQKPLPSWTTYLREIEPEKAPTTSLTCFFKCSPTDVIKTREALKQTGKPRSIQPSSPTSSLLVAGLQSQVEKALLQKLSVQRTSDPVAAKEGPKEEPRKEEPRPKDNPRSREVARPEESVSKDVTSPRFQVKKSNLSAVALVMGQKLVPKPKQGLTDKLEYSVLLDRTVELRQSQRTVEGSVLAFGQIDSNDIEEMGWEDRKVRVRGR